MRRINVWILISLAVVATLPVVAQNKPRTAAEAWGPGLKPNFNRIVPVQWRGPESGPTNTLERLHYWNEIAINASGLDHTPLAPGEIRVFGEQLGPGRAARAMAIVHIAVFEAVNAVNGGYKSYTGLPPARPPTSVDAAIAKAACATLAAMYPSQAATFEQLLAEELGRLPDGRSKTAGIALGADSASRILVMRAADGSSHSEPRVGIEFFPSNAPGYWRKDPISMIPLALGAFWDTVTPFVMTSSDQFRIPPPPALNSPEYTAAYNEVKRLGGDGIKTPTERTDEQRFIGIFWAYDGTPSLCAPPRLYNQIASQIATQKRSSLVETARLLALINVAMADAGIASWESKFHYQLWRPIGGIRESDAGTGPTGLGDGNPDTVGDPTFSPLGAPASGLMGPNFTPPFPAYPSGHATFGGALFQTLRRFYGSDRMKFKFISDEYNGVTVDNQGNIRDLHPRFFSSFSQAEEENGQSRIYLGIHWSFDKTQGIAQGRQIADFVYDRVYTPVQ